MTNVLTRSPSPILKASTCLWISAAIQPIVLLLGFAGLSETILEILFWPGASTAQWAFSGHFDGTFPVHGGLPALVIAFAVNWLFYFLSLFPLWILRSKEQKDPI